MLGRTPSTLGPRNPFPLPPSKGCSSLLQGSEPKQREDKERDEGRERSFSLLCSSSYMLSRILGISFDLSKNYRCSATDRLHIFFFTRSMDFSASYSLYCAEDAASWDAGVGDDSGDEWTPAAVDLIALLSAETERIPSSDYISRSVHTTARLDSINWILKVIDFYRFRPVTAYLSINYLDSFLSANPLPVVKEQNGWPMQLLSVACISIAAKMEETHVPLLLDLQILDPKYLFEPRTIQRMELILMAALQWRMRSITPFDFLPHFASVVLPCLSASRPALFSRAADLIISTRRVLDFIKFRPSAIAGAAVLCAAAELSDSSAADDGDCFICLSEWLSKDDLRACCQLMDQYLIDTCRSTLSNMVKPPTPRSPVGVLETAECGSCDTQKSSTAGIINGEFPPLKRRRLAGSTCTESI